MAKYIDIENATLSWEETDKHGVSDDFANGVLFALDCLTEKEEDIVRCKECKIFKEFTEEYREKTGADGDCGVRVWFSNDEVFCGVKYEDYCSYGKRKETT